LRKLAFIYGLGLVLALSYATFAWRTLDKDLREFQAGQQVDLSTHGLIVICISAPVAIPVLLGMQSLGFGYGEDDADIARVSDTALVAAGTVYWFFGGVFGGKLVLSSSKRAATVVGIVIACSLILLTPLIPLRSPAGALLILLVFLGLIPLLLGITHLILRKTDLSRKRQSSPAIS
jgi:hypothetical protein